MSFFHCLGHTKGSAQAWAHVTRPLLR